MKVLNILATGMAGGIESLCNSIDKYSNVDNYWLVLFKEGIISNQIKKRNLNNNKYFFLGYSKINYFHYYISINKIIKNNNIDIVVLHHSGLYCNKLYYDLIKANKNVKFVRFLHSCYEDKYQLRGKKIYDYINLNYLKKSILFSDLVIGVSNAVKKTYEDKFDLKKDKIKVVYNGIDSSFYQKVKYKKNSYKDKICISYIGRLEPQKGVDILIKAFKKIKNDNNIILNIIGSGSCEKKLKSMVNKNDNIFFKGQQTNVIPYLDNSHIFIYPSLCKEAFGISVVEAMSRGCICIVSKKGGLPEIINDEENGFLVNIFNVDDLSSKIKYVIDNIERMDKISSNAIKTSKYYSIDNTINNICKLYIQLLRSEGNSDLNDKYK